jgi:hypothetical protein
MSATIAEKSSKKCLANKCVFSSQCFGHKSFTSYNKNNFQICATTSKSLYYKTFYDNKLVFVHGKPFQPSLMLVVKTGAYLSKAPFRCSTLG